MCGDFSNEKSPEQESISGRKASGFVGPDGKPVELSSSEEAACSASMFLHLSEHSTGGEAYADAKWIMGLVENLIREQQLDMAEQCLRRAVALFEISRGPDAVEVAGGLTNLGGFLMTTNRLAEAETCLRRALAIVEKNRGENHSDTAAVLSSLATLFSSSDRRQEAEQCFRRAIGITEKLLPPDDPVVANLLVGLGRLLQRENRLPEAEPLCRRAVESYFKAYRATGRSYQELQGAVVCYASVLAHMKMQPSDKSWKWETLDPELRTILDRTLDQIERDR